MKLFFAKHEDGTVTCSNWPIKETGAQSYEFEASEEMKTLVDQGTHDWVIANDQLELKESNRKKIQEEAQKKAAEAQEEAKMLVEKIKNGTATQEEKDAALIKLLEK